MNMPFYIPPEQLMKDRADFARKGIARGRALAALQAGYLAFAAHRLKSHAPVLRFLPPYSPDFNPIEKAFSRLKAMLRKAGERTVGGLWDLIGRLVDMFKPAECANYFRSCGYEPE